MSMIMEMFPISVKEADHALADPNSVHDLIRTAQSRPDSVSLEKSWHGLHFALSQSVWDGNATLNFILEGGEVVGDVDVGYGPARVLHPEDVIKIEDALTQFSNDDFTNNFKTEQMTEDGIYPQIWDEPVEELLAEYLEYFSALRLFISAVAARSEAALIVLR